MSFGLLTGCTDLPEEALSTLSELGLEIEIGELNECSGNQLSIIQEALDDTDNFNKLKSVIQKNKLTVLKINNVKHVPVISDRAVIITDAPLLELTSDPAATSGDIEDLPSTEVTTIDHEIILTTESQAFNKTDISYEVQGLNKVEEMALINELIIEGENGPFISFKKLDNLRINFEIERTYQEFIDELSCGAPITLEEIITNLNGENDVK
jgi:hypothetical protein